MKFAAPFIVALTCCLALTAVHAQDISVSDPVWLMRTPAPDKLPQPKRRLRVEFPSEMKQATDPGYVILTRFVDASGQSLHMTALSADRAYQRAVEEAYQEWPFAPAESGGQPASGGIWMSIIFNPPAVSAKKDSAGARLLAVAPAIVTARMMRDAPQPMLVGARLSIGADGVLAHATPEHEVAPDVWKRVEAALQQWRFAPARQKGQPVASEITLPVVCVAPMAASNGVTVPPKVLQRSPPEYPIQMRRFGLEGKVVVDFVVTRDGTVENAFIVESNNPAFDEGALKSVRLWKFAPGTREGRPVNTHERVPIMFQLTPGGEDAFEIRTGNQDKLPPQFRYDTPPRIRNVQVPVYPYPERHDDIRGKAKVTMLVTRSGHVGYVKVVSADRPEFGLALTAAVEGFEFDPALLKGKPVETVLTIEQSFDDEQLPDEGADDALAAEKRHPEKIVGGKALDAPLKPLSRRPGVFPVSAGENVTHGSAEIDCIISTDGRVVLPRVVQASAPAFGYAAVQAVSGWLFEPPHSGGKAVMVRVRIPFAFNLKSDAPRPQSPPSSP